MRHNDNCLVNFVNLLTICNQNRCKLLQLKCKFFNNWSDFWNFEGLKMPFYGRESGEIANFETAISDVMTAA